MISFRCCYIFLFLFVGIVFSGYSESGSILKHGMDQNNFLSNEAGIQQSDEVDITSQYDKDSGSPDKDKSVTDLLNQFSDEPSTQSQSNTNWTFVFLGIICLGVFSFIGYKLYHYDPKPMELATELRKVEGIITLLAIGLCITPFALIGKITTGSYFNKFIWENLSNENSFWYNPLHMYATLGQFVLTILFIIYSTVTFLLFCDRRTSFPMVATIYYVLFGIYIIADALIARYGDFGIYGPAEYMATIFAGITSVFWMVYLNMSSRVPELFIFRKGQTKKDVLKMIQAKKEKNRSLFLHGQFQ